MQKINCRERFFLDKREASIYVLYVVKNGDYPRFYTTTIAIY